MPATFRATFSSNAAFDASFASNSAFAADFGAVQQVPVGDYEDLANKPSINGVTLIGDKTSTELGIDRTYIYEQAVPSDTWTITHGLDRYPSVTVVDSAGTVVIGDVRYTDENTLVVTFEAAFSGTVYLN